MNRRVLPVLAAAALATATSARADDRLGRLTFDARLGGGVSLVAHSTTFDSAGRGLLDASLELGIALSPGHRMRLLFAPDFVYTTQSYGDPLQPTLMGNRDVFLIAIPLGLEYDIPIRRAPGLYLYPQLLVGYAANVAVLSGDVALQGGATSATLHQGYAQLVFGGRYAFKNRLELLFEPLSLPVYFSRGSALLLYRARVGVGVRF